MSAEGVVRGTADWGIECGDALKALKRLPDATVQACITSPPFWGTRDYGVAGQIGLEPTYPEYVGILVEVFQEVRRILRRDGVLWLNLGDCYVIDAGPETDQWRARYRRKPVEGLVKPLAPPNRRPQPGLKPKDLVGIPWRVALALQESGWWLRSDIVWSKPCPPPEPKSVRDRPTRSHEFLFLLSKSRRYYYDPDAVLEPSGRRALSVWNIAPHQFKEAHFATWPEALVERCVFTSTRKRDLVLDPFCGSGTTGLVALRLGRRFLGVEINAEYVTMAERRIVADAPLWRSSGVSVA